MTEFLRSCSAIILDFDGTLVDSNDIKRRCFADIFVEECFSQVEFFGFIDSLGDADRFDVITACCDIFFSRGYSPREKRRKIDLYSESVHKQILSSDAIDGSRAFIEKARAREKLLFVSSATPQRNLEKAVGALGLSGYFNGVYGSPESKVSHIKKVMEDNSLQSTDITYIGDSDSDYNASVQCNCHFFGIITRASRFSTDPAEQHYGFRNLTAAL